MPVFFAVVRKELATTVGSPLGRRITVIHLSLALLAVLLGWPVSYILGDAHWAPSLAWWVYAELLMLSYLAIAIPADALEVESEIRPGDWVSYGNASPISVHLGETCAALLALGFWLITALPAFLMGLILSPIANERLQALAGFSLLVLAALTQVGAWIGVAVDSRSFRIILVDFTFAAIMVGSLIIQAASARSSDLQIFTHPLEVAAQILNMTAQEAFFGSAAGTLVGLSIPAMKTPSPLESIPWVSIVVVYGAVLLVAGSLSVMVLRQWQQRQVDKEQ